MLTSLLCHASCRSLASGNARDIPGPLEKMRAFAMMRSGSRKLVRTKIPHWKFACTYSAELTVTVQVGEVPVHGPGLFPSPAHPVNVLPLSGVAVSVTLVPAGENTKPQVDP